MKRFLPLFLLLPVLVSAQKKLTVTGKINGLKEGSVVSLVSVSNPPDSIGKAIVKNGVFTITKELKAPVMATLNLDNGNRISFFLDNSKITMTGNAADPKSIIAKGSATQDVFIEFQKKFNPHFDKLNGIYQKIQRTGNTDSLNKEMTASRADVQKEITTFIAKYKASPVSAFILLYTIDLTDDIILTEQRFNKLDAKAIKNMYGDYLKNSIEEGKFLAVGTPALDFTQNDTLGNPISLSSFRGKYVLIDFWASWCGPCRQENPNVVNNYQKFKEKNFTVLGVSLDRKEQKDRWLQAIHADNLTWTHVSDLQFWNNAVAQQYRVQSIPQNFLVSPDGKIIAKNLRGPALESKLCELLGCN